MKVYELILTGYDGSTDKTDDRIFWICAPDGGTIRDALQLYGVPSALVETIDHKPELSGVSKKDGLDGTVYTATHYAPGDLLRKIKQKAIDADD